MFMKNKYIITCVEYRQKGHLIEYRAASSEVFVVFSQILSYKCLSCLKLVSADCEEISSPPSWNSNSNYTIYVNQQSLTGSNQYFFFRLLCESQSLSIFLARKMIAKSLKSQIVLEALPKLLNSNLKLSKASMGLFRMVALFKFCQGSLS